MIRMMNVSLCCKSWNECIYTLAAILELRRGEAFAFFALAARSLPNLARANLPRAERWMLLAALSCLRRSRAALFRLFRAASISALLLILLVDLFFCVKNVKEPLWLWNLPRSFFNFAFIAFLDLTCSACCRLSAAIASFFDDLNLSYACSHALIFVCATLCRAAGLVREKELYLPLLDFRCTPPRDEQRRVTLPPPESRRGDRRPRDRTGIYCETTRSAFSSVSAPLKV